MKKIALAVGLGVVFFLAGLIGTYYTLPIVAPDHVPDTVTSDSLNTAAPDSTQPFAAAQLDSTALTDSASTATIVDSLGISPDQLNDVPLVQQLRDSLSTLQDSLSTLTADSRALTEERDALQERVKSLESSQAKAADIGNTLTKLEDEELRAVLNELDMRVYEMLYNEVSGRNRARLLQSLPPDKAAQLVDRMILQTNN